MADGGSNLTTMFHAVRFLKFTNLLMGELLFRTGRGGEPDGATINAAHKGHPGASVTTPGGIGGGAQS